MPRLLAIDFGGKRTGIAVSDPQKIIASALTTLASQELVPFLKDYCEKEEVEAFVLGMPHNTDGSATNATEMVENLARHLQKVFPDIPLHLHDERFTSKMALDAMIRTGSKKKDRQNKGNIDKISATIILQSFMEANP